MVNDPADRYAKVAEEHGEAEAARSLIRGTKRLVTVFVVIMFVVSACSVGMVLYTRGRVDSCRALVETQFQVGVGDVITEFRQSGTLAEDTFRDFLRRRDNLDNVTEVCPGGFWPWQLPSDPADS